jgi:hypothetical protein
MTFLQRKDVYSMAFCFGKLRASCQKKRKRGRSAAKIKIKLADSLVKVREKLGGLMTGSGCAFASSLWVYRKATT